MGDHRVENFFLMQSPKQPFIITTAYVLLVAIIGPHYMAKTKRFHLLPVIRLYNVLQILFNAYIFVTGMMLQPDFSIWCTPSDPGQSKEVLQTVRLHHLFVMLKMFDLIETIFFVLRKKMDQVTFLHVFHHVGLVWITWISCKNFPGGQSLWPAGLNTLAHIFMYAYYLRTSWGQLRNTLWKKCLTTLQIGHQVAIFFIYLLPLFNPNCSYPKLYLGLTVGYMIVIICLFLKFYRNSYTYTCLGPPRLNKSDYGTAKR